MAQLAGHVIDEVKRRADIVEVVSGYIPLKKAGVNYKALCPFHNEKTPSFSVNPSRGIFHCFGCGEGGDSIGFVIKHENVSFPEAIRILAGKYGIEIVETRTGEADTQKDRAYKALSAAADFYHDRLKRQGAGGAVANYIEERGLTGELIEKFQLGWAPDEWESLLNHLKNKGFNEKVIETAGLTKISSRDNPIDRFRGRLMFPICDLGGRVIAFGGRIIAESENAPKYINSPETPIYKKSYALYGLDKSKNSARKENSLIVVEGYMDVLALWAAGVENCAAVAGTAFTSWQAESIKRICDTVVVMFDSDDAGISAAKKSVPALLDNGLKVKVLTLPGAKDPDEFLKSNDTEEFKRLAAEAPSFPDFIIDVTLNKADLGKIEDRVRAAREALPFLKMIKDRIERQYYLEQLAERAQVDSKALLSESRGGAANPASLPAYRFEKTKKETAKSKAERILLRILLDSPEYLDSHASDLTADDFETGGHKAIFGLLQQARERAVEAVTDLLALTEDDDLRKSVTGLSMEKNLYDEESAGTAAADCVRSIKYSPQERRNRLKEQALSVKEQDKENFPEKQKKYIESRQDRL